MEFIVWYMGKESRAKELAQCQGQGWPEVELSQFMGDFLFTPLFAMLNEKENRFVVGEILDQTLYTDPELLDEAKLCSGEATGYYVQRVNPDLVSLLAEIPSRQIPSLADQWRASPEMAEFYKHWDQDEARQEVVRMLKALSALAKRAVNAELALMELAYL